MIIFITGGVRSGKSTFALQVGESKVSEKGVIHYIATSRRSDTEMEDRIIRHIEERQLRDKDYVTHEKSIHIEELMVNFKQGDAVILDCLTGLVTAEFFSSIDQGLELWKEGLFQQQLLERLSDTFVEISQSGIPFIVVSNELFEDIIPNDESTIAFMKVMGSVHQKLVSFCNQAYLVESGIPILKKDVGVG